jgi:hypothetical protein
VGVMPGLSRLKLVAKTIQSFKPSINGLRLKAKAVKALAVTMITLGNTTSVDISQISNTITSMLPLIITLIGIAIPLIFIKYIMRFLEKILSGFG